MSEKLRRTWPPCTRSSRTLWARGGQPWRRRRPWRPWRRVRCGSARRPWRAGWSTRWRQATTSCSGTCALGRTCLACGTLRCAPASSGLWPGSLTSRTASRTASEGWRRRRAWSALAGRLVALWAPSKADLKNSPGDSVRAPIGTAPRGNICLSERPSPRSTRYIIPRSSFFAKEIWFVGLFTCTPFSFGFLCAFFTHTFLVAKSR
mmetsp:Transcript_66366/g.114060  ORF Transcript_66366/g.114060 Transcript_66366/m.114060 type:complete len:206 (-) Transcript_66366:13-630(-)